MSDLVGKTLSNRYQVLGLLGQGGMGGVYRGYDPVLKRQVAIKVMHVRFAEKGDLLSRFQQEGRIAARLNHPGIVQVYDFGEIKGQYYIVMEMIEGENLDQMMQHLRVKQQWIRLTEASALVRQVATALAYAHGNGVVHRDIKPANIMLKEIPLDELPYQPVVTDFGVAKLLEGGMQTQAGMTVGTPAYMSPEQTRGEELDSRSDVYSLGVLFYELAVGQMPFRIRSLTEALHFHTREAPPPPHTLRPDLPRAVEAIILKSLAKERSQRYSSAAEFGEDLRLISSSTLPDTVPPTATMASTLLTQYRESIVASRLLSVVPETPNLAVREPQIVVRTPSGEEQTIIISTPRISIGRVDTNDLVLRDDRVSRQHAVVELTGGRYTVTDLESLNGTYVGGERIQPKIKVPWEPGQALKIGDHHLFLQLPGTMSGSMPDSMSGSSFASYAGASSMANSLAEERRAARPVGPSLSITVEPSELRVEPGQVVSLKATVANQGGTAQQVTITASGLASQWITSLPPTLSIPAGARQSVTLTLSPPRSAQLAPQRYPLTLQAAAPGQAANASVNSNVAILPYTEYRSKIIQQSGGSHESWQVEIENKGNREQRFQIVAEDPEDVLLFEPEEQTIRAERGGTSYADIRVRPRVRPLVGVGKSYPFQLRVQAEGETAATHEGVYTRKPIIPIAMSISLLVIFLVMVAAAGLVLYDREFGSLGFAGGLFSTAPLDSTSTITATATTTATVAATPQTTLTAEAVAAALVVEGTRAATTATAAAQKTAQAIATSTANWQVLDDDRDGLTNGEEVSRNLLPNEPDTDADEINDGDEVNLYQTDPFAKDTDGDSLPDGSEVQKGLNPLSDDSDGDGALDNVDPDPLHVATFTPTPTITPDLTATAAATATIVASTREAEALIATATAEFEAILAQQTRDAEAVAQQVAQAQAAAQTATAIVASANATAAAIQAAQNAISTAQAMAAYATAQAAAAYATAAAEATHHAQQNQPTATPTPSPTEEPHEPQQPLYAEIVQTGAGHNGDSVSGALVFQVVAIDPNVGNNDGDGIDNVRLQIFQGNHKVYERQENNAAYCAFSGGEPDCNVWYFHDHNNEWPDGDDVENDNYTLRARVRAHSGQEVTIERHISISN